MPSALNALPTITGTALGASLATGIAAGQYKTPTAVAGFMVPLDSLNFYVENTELTNFGVNATATGTNIVGPAAVTQTVQKGANFFINITNVGATTTLGINIQGQDQSSNNWITIARASFDGIQTGITGETGLQVYPGLTTQASMAYGTIAQVNAHIGHIWRVQASVTATASGGGASLSFTVQPIKIT